MKKNIIEVHNTQDALMYDGPVAASIQMTPGLKAKIKSAVEICQANKIDGCFFYDRTPDWLDLGEDEGQYSESNVRIDSCQLKVYKDGDFVWKATEKHTEVPFETGLMTLSDFDGESEDELMAIEIEPDAVKTEDGYTFKRLSDGSYSDGDISWPTWRDFEYACDVKWTPIFEQK